MLNQNAIIIIDVNGNVLREPIGSFRANSNYTSSITVIAPFELDSVVSANYSKKNRKNDDIAQFLIPNGNKKGKDIIGENDPLYQLIHDWHVFEADVDQLAVAYFAKYRSDMLFVSIGVGNIVKPAKAITYKGEFGIDNPLPEVAGNGDYYVSKNYNFMDKNIQWTLNDYAYYDNGWKKSNYRGEAFTEPIELLVDPAVEANYEIQEDLDLSILLAGRLAIVESSVIQLDGKVDTHIEDLNNPHGVTAEQVDTYVKTTIDSKDANTLQQAKDYTYSKVEIDNKDTAVMNKVNNLENANMFKDVNYNNVNGVLTFTRYDDTTKAIDLPLELLVESGYYDEVTNELVLVLANGSDIRIPVGNLLTDLDAHNIRFNGSGTNYLVAKTEVESAVKELDTRVKANADNVALKVNTSDIIDDLTSTDTNKPLSANQGKVLNDTKENLSNKATNFSVVNDTKYPTTKAVNERLLNLPIAELNNHSLREVFEVANLITNSTFDTNTNGWTKRYSGTISWVNGRLKYDTSIDQFDGVFTLVDFIDTNIYYITLDWEGNTDTYLVSGDTETYKTTSIREVISSKYISNGVDVFAIRNRLKNTTFYIDNVYAINQTSLGISTLTVKQMNYWLSVYQALLVSDTNAIFSMFASKQQEAWIEPTLINGFTRNPISPIMYMKDNFGFIHIKGRITSPDTSTKVAFILPVGYRPNTNMTCGYTKEVGQDRIEISSSSGSVTLYSPSVSLNSLDNISFKGE